MEDGSATEETTGAETAQETATAEETVSRAEHERQLDRYRNQFGQEKKAREDLEKRLKELETANQTEAERLAAKAKRADELEPQLTQANSELETLRAALAAEVEAQTRALPKALRDLLPEGSPVQQLEWIRKANAAAKDLNGGLPPGGERRPPRQTPKDEPTEEERAAALQTFAQRF